MTVDLAAKRQQIGGSRLAVADWWQQQLRWVFHVGFLLGLVLILVWDGFLVGLN